MSRYLLAAVRTPTCPPLAPFILLSCQPVVGGFPQMKEIQRSVFPPHKQTAVEARRAPVRVAPDATPSLASAGDE